MNNKIVYIVHCIDTEGPLYESLDETFSRIQKIYNIKLEPTRENLIKLQKKEIDLGGIEELVRNLVDTKRLTMNETWNDIDKMLNTILSNNYRNELKDSYNKGWIYNWFCMDHVGFHGYNPRRRDAGYHNIFDYYIRLTEKYKEDLVQWHYHPVPFSGNYNDSATAYIAGKNIFEILSRKIIDKQWFPASYRPGFHTERPDSNWFLEQWIPFDYANQSKKWENVDQPDLANGRFGDWRRAPKEWVVYHPSHDDYQIEGTCRRWIARCLNMESRIRELTVDDVRDAFKRANSGKKTLLSFTNHDFRNMEPEINKVREMIKIVSGEYKDVQFKFTNAIDAMRNVLELETEKIDLRVELIKGQEKILKVETNDKIFGPQPFLALKTIDGRYFWDNFDFEGNNRWTYTFDNNTFNLSCIESVGIAANSSSGVTEIVNYDVLNDIKFKNILNY